MRHLIKMLYNVLKLYIRLIFVCLAHPYVKLQAVVIKSFSAEYFYQCRRSPLLTIYCFSDMIDLRLSLAARAWWIQSLKAERSEASTRESAAVIVCGGEPGKDIFNKTVKDLATATKWRRLKYVPSPAALTFLPLIRSLADSSGSNVN